MNMPTLQENAITFPWRQLTNPERTSCKVGLDRLKYSGVGTRPEKKHTARGRDGRTRGGLFGVGFADFVKFRKATRVFKIFVLGAYDLQTF
jgi:hypothetical protein